MVWLDRSEYVLVNRDMFYANRTPILNWLIENVGLQSVHHPLYNQAPPENDVGIIHLIGDWAYAPDNITNCLNFWIKSESKRSLFILTWT